MIIKDTEREEKSALKKSEISKSQNRSIGFVVALDLLKPGAEFERCGIDRGSDVVCEDDTELGPELDKSDGNVSN
ncbi:hypothetical protein ANO14919_061400 [Xylariales sp. No.14919]|nr:hypothetical protein ANO14919_061400 [Xylariales sp. No.14919]